MTVEAIRLQNFMAFKDTGWVGLRPITLLFGRNSSGKSVLTRALLLLRQSLRSVQKEQPFVLSDLYGVDIGSFREMVHQGDEKSRVCFHFRCKSVEIEEWLATSKIAELRTFSTRTLQIALEYAARRNESGGVDLSHIDLTRLCIQAVSTDAQQDVLLFEAMALEPEDVDRFGDEWFVRGLLTEQGKPGAWSGFGCKLDRNFLDIQFIEPTSPNEATGYQLLKQLLQIPKGEIQKFLEGIVHLGPIRPEPQRRYSFSRNTADEWQRRDWTAFRDFIAGRLNEDEVREISAWLKRLDLAESVETRLVSEVGALFTEFEVAFQESGEAMPLPLSAMGFGASQVLPIIVQCVKANQGGLVIIEQPELHLHPRAQAHTGDLFIQTTLRKALNEWRKNAKRALDEKSEMPVAPTFSQELELSGPPGSYLLIETHSEHLLFRLRRRIAETHAYALKRSQISMQDGYELPEWLLSKDDLSVQFVYRDKDRESRIVQVDIDAQGDLNTSQAPPQFDDFFADDLIELAAIVRALT